MSRSFTPAPGYVPCACRDCFETAIGTPGALCHECDDAGCAPERECQAADAYGGESEALTEPPPASIIRSMCEQQGFYLVTEDSYNPGVILARVLAVLRVLDPAAHAIVTGPGSRVSRIPAEAHDDERHPHWDGDGSATVTEVFAALDAAAPAGCCFTADREWHRLGFFK